MTEIVDCHSHTALSGHGEGTIAEAVARAERLGLTTYAQTEHLVLPERVDPLHESSMPAGAVDGYIAELLAQRAALAERGSQMELLVGIEADWLDGRAGKLRELCAPFEYVIGSVHYLDEWPMDDSRFIDGWHERGPDAVWRRYFEVWLDMAASDAPIDTLGHPDLPKKFGLLPSFDVTEYYAAMAEAAAKRGCMVEVNTSGLRTDAGEMYPSPQLLEMFCRAGVECTVGCDAHRAADIAANVEDAYGLMRRAGYRYVAVPTRGHDRRYVKLEE